MVFQASITSLKPWCVVFVDRKICECNLSNLKLHHLLAKFPIFINFVWRYPFCCVILTQGLQMLTSSFLILDSGRWKGFYIGKYTSRTEGKGFFGACNSNRWKGILENTPLIISLFVCISFKFQLFFLLT